MATFEGMGFCDKQEYQRAFETRLRHADLTRDDLYVARFELEHTDRAYRILGRVALVANSVSSPTLARLDVTLLDDMLRPLLVAPSAGFMEDGVWNPLMDMHICCVDGSKAGLINGCFGDYEGNVGTQFETFLSLAADPSTTSV